MAYTVAVLGATGLVGSHLIQLLESRQFPVKRLKPLASQRSLGNSILFQGQPIPVEEATPEAFEGVDLVLASAGGSISARLVPEAIKRGAVVVDNTSEFRMHPQVPLVVAGVNNADLDWHQGIVANPNCSTAQLMPVLKALHSAVGLKRVIISTYQSVSGAGKEGLEELREGLTVDMNNSLRHAHELETLSDQYHSPQVFQRPIAFNLIPHIDVFSEADDDTYGYTREELKLIRETRKILDLPELPITATAVRVPVLVGHSESVTVDLESPLSPEQAAQVLRNTPDVVVASSLTDYHTPRETAGTDPVYVSRIRRDTSNLQTGLNLWVVADNLRIGAALNAVRLAELLHERGKLAPVTASALVTV
ncbi:MAG: aspartate-semialdehyde dehydrogenase [Candidatus Melainabacteria bacterium]|nr:aspartate-semialdehyde dehydrogenase [Candidatus Melainabacteria bacterium]